MQPSSASVGLVKTLGFYMLERFLAGGRDKRAVRDCSCHVPCSNLKPPVAHVSSFLRDFHSFLSSIE